MVGVYLVNPALIASIAASLIKSGVSKSGSPAARLITSLPSDLSFLAFEVMLKVTEGFTFLSDWRASSQYASGGMIAIKNLFLS